MLIVPLKMVMFVWKVLRDRITLKHNLSCRSLWEGEDVWCVGCQAAVESTKKLFVGGVLLLIWMGGRCYGLRGCDQCEK